MYTNSCFIVWKYFLVFFRLLFHSVDFFLLFILLKFLVWYWLTYLFSILLLVFLLLQPHHIWRSSCSSSLYWLDTGRKIFLSVLLEILMLSDLLRYNTSCSCLWGCPLDFMPSSSWKGDGMPTAFSCFPLGGESDTQVYVVSPCFTGLGLLSACAQ